MAHPSFWKPLLLVSSLPLGGLLGACSGQDAGPPAVALNPNLDWYGDNQARINGLLDQLAQSPSDAPHPVAVLNFSDTIVKNDLADIGLYYMLRTGAVRQPSDRNWRLTSLYLTPAALVALHNACDALAEPGQPLATNTDAGAACATEIVSIYDVRQTAAKQVAFTGWNGRRMQPNVAWATQLLAGYSADEARAIGRRALAAALTAQLDAAQPIGNSDDRIAWMRIYSQQQDLLSALHQRNVDVYLVSGAAQPFVEVAAERLGIAADHVIGTRLVESAGLLTANLQGCGDVPDGNNDGQGGGPGNSLMPLNEGKRCFINQLIFGIHDAAALMRQSDPALRPIFAAGASDDDAAMLADASGLRLALNTNAKELMCSAYANAHGSWIVNPMFSEPLPQAVPYKCTTTACKNETGKSTPCKDEDGMPIPDQQDKVFVPAAVVSP